MIVVTMTDCPPALRGDLSKWLQEINTGVYVGQVSARVRDKLWERITSHIKTGRATMVFDASNEQGMDFRIHNTSWEIVDQDGLKLVRRPSEQRMYAKGAEDCQAGSAPGFSKAAQYRKLGRMVHAPARKEGRSNIRDITAVDVETTGLDAKHARIVEIAALRVRNNQVVESFSALIKAEHPLPPGIVELTGLTDVLLDEKGISEKEALQGFMSFIGEDVLLIHNAPFDLAFLREACMRQGLPQIANQSMDTCALARKALLKVPDYKLSTLAACLGVAQRNMHRALPDCNTALEVYQKLTQTE